MNEQASNELIYESTSVSHSNVRYTKVLPINGTSSIAFGATSTPGPTEFLTSPNACMNLARSVLQWDVALGATGSANLGNVLATNPLSYISRVVVSLQSGQILLDLNNVSRLATSTTHAFSSYVDSMSNCNGTPILSTSTAAASLVPFDIVNRADTDTGLAANFYSDVVVADCGPSAPREFALALGSAAALSYASYQFRFGDAFKHTILGLDKLLYFADNTLSIQLYFNGHESIGWGATTVGALYPTTIAGTASLTSLTMSNLSLVLAQESNYDLVRQVVALSRSEKGIEIPVGYVYAQKTNQTGQQHSIQYQLTQGFGNSVNFIVWSPFQFQTIGDKWINSFNNCIDVSAHGGGVNVALSSYNTYMDQLPISNSGFLYDVTHGEQWFANSRSLHKSMVLSSADYSKHFAHFDNYTSGSLNSFDQTSQQGLSLKEPHIYSVNCNFAGAVAVNHFVWIFTNRILKINSAGVQLV